ncbi:MAG: hypothetical protein R3F60_23955 [bacterium]
MSVGSVYQYFANKKALYQPSASASSGGCGRRALAVSPALLAQPPAQVLSDILETLLRPVVSDPILNGMLHVTALPPRDFEAINLFERELEAHTTLLISAHPDLRGRFPDPALSARLLVRAAAGGVARTLALEPETVPTPAFRRELVRLVAGYLGVDPGPEPAA